MLSCIGTMMYVVSVTAPRSWTSTRTVEPGGCSGDSPTHMTICAVLSGDELGVDDDVGLTAVVASGSDEEEPEQAAKPSISRQPSIVGWPLSRMVIIA